MSDVAETFHELVGNLEYPMFIVTARAGRRAARAAWSASRRR